MGPVLLRRPAVSRTITLQNDGPVSATIRFDLDGDAATDWTCNRLGTLLTLPAYARDDMTVTFVPGAVGPRSAFLRMTILRNTEGGLVFALTGSGCVKSVTLEPASGSEGTLEFGDINVSASVQQTLIMRNTGSKFYR